MGLLRSVAISASALAAQRLRMDVVANNVANMNSTKGPDGGPFRRQVVSFQARLGQPGPTPLSPRGPIRNSPTEGVVISRLESDNSPGRRVYDPSHPDADDDGFVEMPNVNMVIEMTDMVAAARAYEASVTVLNATKSMAQRALQIGRG